MEPHMLIQGIKEFLDRRAASEPTSSVIQRLEAAAAAAAATGDLATATALQMEADRLRRSSMAANIIISPRPKSQPAKPLNVRHVVMQWRALEPSKVYTGDGVCVLDCGDRGTATITATAVTLSGALQNEPIAVLLMARHAQQHWGGKAVAFGTTDFKFQVAVASKMLKVKTARARIPRNRRADADELAKDWRPIVDSKICGMEPDPPKRRRPLTISRPDFVN